MRLRKTKVLLFAEFGETGGTRTYLIQLVELYACVGVELVMIVPGEKADEEISKLFKRFNFLLITRDQISEKKNFQVGGLLRRYYYEKKVFSKFIKSYSPDLIVCSVGTVDLFLGVASCSSKSLYILHTYPEISPNFFRRLYRKIVYSFIFYRKIHLLTVSDFAKNQINNVFGLWFGGSVYRVYNSSILTGIKRNFNMKIPIQINILTVGHVEGYKNPLLWIDVAVKVLLGISEACNIVFTWVGEGTLLEICRKKVNSLGLSHKIKFVGSSCSISEFYDVADIYFQPSSIESLGIGVLDSMLYSLPSVVSSVGGLPELVSNGLTGYLVNEEDIDGFTAAISSLIENDDQRLNFGANAHVKYMEGFNKDRWQFDTWEIHKRVLNN
jgi:glycosyltransferase involved in cell wall biosynthesis